MKNEGLKKILDTYKNKSNKELSNIAMGLHGDFQAIKAHMIELTETVAEIEVVYNQVLDELQKRLKFDDPQKPAVTEDGDGN